MYKHRKIEAYLYEMALPDYNIWIFIKSNSSEKTKKGALASN